MGAKPEKPKPTLEDALIDMKINSKRLARESQKSMKESQNYMKKAKDALRKNN
jgi:charged multivesicular body protein 1